jgi:AhpD family alkylhydroperoxidase
MEPRLDYYKASPEAMKSLQAMEQRCRCGFGKALAELVRLRVSLMNGCAYCIDVHTANARKAGESDRRLAALPVWRETPFFSDRERAALEWAEAVTAVAESHVPDEVWHRVKPHFTPEEIVDLTLMITTINTWNRFAIAFRKLPS